MQDFFRKHGVAVMTIRELFDFIVDPCIADEDVDGYLEEVWSLCFQALKFFDFCAVVFYAKRIQFDRYSNYLNVIQVQQKIMSRGDLTAEDEIADSVFVQVT